MQGVNLIITITDRSRADGFCQWFRTRGVSLVLAALIPLPDQLPVFLRNSLSWIFHQDRAFSVLFLDLHRDFQPVFRMIQRIVKKISHHLADLQRVHVRRNLLFLRLQPERNSMLRRALLAQKHL